MPNPRSLTRGPSQRVARAIALIASSAFALGAHGQKQKEPWEYLQEPAFKAAYAKALGPKAGVPWLAKRDGPAPQDKFIEIAGERFVMNSFCKNHDCNANSAVLLWSPDRKVVYGTVYEKGRTTLIGDPPPAVAGELGKLWKKEWRAQP